jgi:hypothetical protein
VAAARGLLAAILLAAGHAVAPAQPDRTQPPGHITELDNAKAPSALAIGDPLALLGLVLRSVPDRVPVYAAADRDKGKLHFAYGEAPTDRRPSPKVRHVVLDASQGVAVASLSANAYRITHAGRSVTFALNDLAHVKPPPGLLRPDDTFLSTIFDESAVQFFLAFNARLKSFHYLLDDTGAAADEWAAASEGIVIGKRTGFAFYRDGERKILVGILERNSRLNTAFDGPFDQLPENSIEGEALREAIVAADPGAKGKIDRLGNFIDGSGRYLIHPYSLYRAPGDLAVFPPLRGGQGCRCGGKAALFRHQLQGIPQAQTVAAGLAEALRTRLAGTRSRLWNGPTKASCWAPADTARRTQSLR